MEEKEEIIDERTGEVIPVGSPNTLPQRDVAVVQVNANTIGTLELDEKAESVLDEALKPEDVKIRPDGLVYLPWTWYAERLNRAFGRLKWGLLPQGSPQSKNTGNNNVLVVWGFWLVVKGIPVSFAMGETSYRTNNSTMSYADAVAGAKSSALARNCKEMGMALQLFDPQWIEPWKAEFASHIPNPSKPDSKIWVRKDDKRYIKAPKPATKPAKEVPVDEAFPEPEIVTETRQMAGGHTAAQFRKDAAAIAQIREQSGKPIPEIMAIINAIPEREKRTVGQIVKELKGEQ